MTRPIGGHWGRYASLVSLYWRSPEGGRAAGLLVLALAAAVGSSLLLILESLQRGEFISALAARQSDRIQQAAWQLAAVLVGTAVLLALATYLRERLGLAWRRWLTRNGLERYLKSQRYYHLTAQTTLDNPDQRLTEDIGNLTQGSVVLLGIGVESVVQLVGFAGVLWGISPTLTLFLALYGLLGSAVTLGLFGPRLTALNIEQLKREADFRYGLIDLGEQAEAVALTQGQRWERQRLGQRFQQAVGNFKRLIRWQFGLDLWQNGYQYFTFVLPGLILAPRILGGELEVGAIVQSQAAFDRIWLSVSLIVVQFEQLTALAASLGRLDGLYQVLETPAVAPGQNLQIIDQKPLALVGLSLFTPDRQRLLIHNLSLAVPPGQHLLICGPSGVGKSALVRAIAGLWEAGEGTLYRPPGPEMVFLPQRPYVGLGTLRQQILYPRVSGAIADHTLRQLLHQVHLPHLAEISLEAETDWSQQLSLGEQQRLALARLLLQAPVYAVLDEATSALTLEQEQAFYQCLAETAITLVSVGHRPSLRLFHRQQLTLAGDATWHLTPLSCSRPVSP